VKSNWHILLVEDDAGIGEPLSELLELEPRPDLILLDIMMPEMSGWEFREIQLKMQRDIAEIPVFILSADHRARAQVDESRNEFFFSKPVDVDRLCESIQTKLSK